MFWRIINDYGMLRRGMDKMHLLDRNLIDTHNNISIIYGAIQ